MSHSQDGRHRPAAKSPATTTTFGQLIPYTPPPFPPAHVCSWLKFFPTVFVDRKLSTKTQSRFNIHRFSTSAPFHLIWLLLFVVLFITCYCHVSSFLFVFVCKEKQISIWSQSCFCPLLYHFLKFQNANDVGWSSRHLCVEQLGRYRLLQRELDSTRWNSLISCWLAAFAWTVTATPNCYHVSTRSAWSLVWRASSTTSLARYQLYFVEF